MCRLVKDNDTSSRWPTRNSDAIFSETDTLVKVIDFVEWTAKVGFLRVGRESAFDGGAHD